MSHLNILKRKKTFKTKLTLISIFALSALLSANTALAGPDKAVAPAEEVTEEITKDVKENVQDQLQNSGKDEMSNIDTEGTIDEGTIDESTIDIVEEPTGAQAPIIEDSLTAKDTSSQSIIVIPVKKNKQNCYPQDDGTIECVCETDETCAALKASDFCEPDTLWGNSEGLGGCTKKTED